MKIFYKKIDEKIYNGSHEVPVRIFFPNEKSFQESEDKRHDSKDKKLLLFIHGGGLVTESIDNYEESVQDLQMQPGSMLLRLNTDWHRKISFHPD